MNTSRIYKVTAAWISIVYIICFGGVALVPGIREWFMENALHTRIELGSDVMTLETFVTGLIIWNVVALLAVWLYAALDKYFAKST